MAYAFKTFKKFDEVKEFSPVIESHKKVFEVISENEEIVLLREKHAKELKEAKENAYKNGFNDGYKNGYSIADNEAKQTFIRDLKTIQNIINSATNFIDIEKKKAIDEIKRNTPDLMWQICNVFFDESEDVLKKSLINRINNTLDNLLNNESIEIYLNPTDLRIVRENIQFKKSAFKLIQDDNIKIGGFVIKSTYTKIDGQIDQFLKLVKEKWNE